MHDLEHAPPNTENVPAKRGRDMHGAVCRYCGKAGSVARMTLIDRRWVCQSCAKKVT